MASNVTTAPNQLKQHRVIMWCVPRSLSTAYLRAMSNADHAFVWCEPYMMVKKLTDDPEPGQSFMEIMKSKDNSSAPKHFYSLTNGEGTTYEWVKQNLEMEYPDKKLIFVKEMVEGIDGHYDMLPNGYRHTFLIRHPLKVFASLKKSHIDPKMCRSKRVREGPLQQLTPDIIPAGFFFKEMCDLMDYLVSIDKAMPVILDADDVSANPTCMLKLYCQKLGIPFTDDLVHWKSGEALFDNWMAPKELMYIFQSTEYHKSSVGDERRSGFEPSRDLPSRSELPSDVIQAADDSMKYYLKLYEQRLVLNSPSNFGDS